MIYRGFEIKKDEYALKYGTRVSGWRIYQNGKPLLMAADKELAKRVIDTRLKSGIWKTEVTADEKCTL